MKLKLHNRIAKSLLKYLFKYLAKRFGLSFLTGFWGTAAITILTPLLGKLLQLVNLNLEQQYYSFVTEKDKKEYYSIMKENRTKDVSKMTPEQKQKLQKSFLKKISRVLSVNRFIKK